MIKSLYIKNLSKGTLNEEHDKIRKLLKLIYAFYTENVKEDELCILLDRDTDEKVITAVKKRLIDLYDDPDKCEEKTFPVPNLSDIYSHLIFLAERAQENNNSSSILEMKNVIPSLNDDINISLMEEEEEEKGDAEEVEPEEQQVEVEVEEEETKASKKSPNSKTRKVKILPTPTKRYALRKVIKLSEKAKSNNNRQKSISTTQKPKKRVRETDSYEVEKILGKRTIKNVTEYLVQWRGYPGQDTWERYSNFDTKEIVDEYDRKHPNA